MTTTIKPVLFFLGLCSGYTSDYDTSVMLCEMEYSAQYRVLVPYEITAELEGLIILF